MSLHFNAFGEPCLDNTSQYAPDAWSQATPLDGDLMQKSLDALLQNDLTQNSSCSHIQVVNYPNDTLDDGTKGFYNISNIRMNDRDGFVVMTGEGWRQSDAIDAPYIVNKNIDLGILPPAPPELSGTNMQLIANVDNNGDTYIKWVATDNIFSFRKNANTEITFDKADGGFLSTLGTFDLSNFQDDESTIAFIKLHINGEIGFKNDAKIEDCSAAFLAIAGADASINSYYITSDATTTWLNVSPLQRINLASDTNMYYLFDKIAAEAASRSDGTSNLYTDAFKNYVSSPTATMEEIGYSKAPFNIDVIVDGDVLQQPSFSIGLSAAFATNDVSINGDPAIANAIAAFDMDNFEITWNTPRSWFVDVYYNNKTI